ncbi:MAG: hypothetical protein K0S51_227 [Bacillales bacterium]|jgi:two-component system sporulation sensor kinase B|nr:hypothetical protein [Bacillales bacterium]
MFKDIMLNTLVILTPVLLFQVFFPSTQYVKGTKQRVFWGIICSAMIIICMNFPLFSNDIMWDLRYVPLIFSFFYGGFLSGILTYIPFIIYRATFDLDIPFIIASVTMTTIFLVLMYIRNKIDSLNTYHKIYLATALNVTFNTIGFLLSNYYLIVTTDESGVIFDKLLFVYLISTVISSIIIVLIIPMIENYNVNQILKEESYKAEKLSVVSEMAASIAHEIRNPLTVVRGFIQLSLEKSNDQDKLYMNTAIEELDRAELIISEYLSYARPSMPVKEEIDVSNEVASVVELIKSFANINSVELTYSAEKNLRTLADKLHLRQILINLVKNSIEACSNKNSKVIVTLTYSQGFICVEVIDNGKGMTEEQLSGLGNPYFTTKETGTGLGLTVTFDLIKNMNGTLKYESEFGQGTKAIIKIPGYKYYKRSKNG